MDIYLNFKNQARAALAFYGEIFDTKATQITTYGEMPAEDSFHVKDEIKDLILNAQMMIDGTCVMFSDVPEATGMTVTIGDNISLVLQPKTAAEAERLFAALAQGGRIDMALAPTFWAKLYGMVTDKFGIQWQLSVS